MTYFNRLLVDKYCFFPSSFSPLGVAFVLNLLKGDHLVFRVEKKTTNAWLQMLKASHNPISIVSCGWHAHIGAYLCCIKHEFLMLMLICAFTLVAVSSCLTSALCKVVTVWSGLQAVRLSASHSQDCASLLFKRGNMEEGHCTPAKNGLSLTLMRRQVCFPSQGDGDSDGSSEVPLIPVCVDWQEEMASPITEQNPEMP